MLTILKSSSLCLGDAFSASGRALVFTLLFVSASSHVIASEREDLEIARRVLAARDQAHWESEHCLIDKSLFGDPRIGQLFWDTARLKIIEGAKLTLAQSKDVYVPAVTPNVDSNRPLTNSELLKYCFHGKDSENESLDAINGLTARELERMRNVYLSSQPGPHPVRDAEIRLLCMIEHYKKAGFEGATAVCDCVQSAVDRAPQAEYD